MKANKLTNSINILLNEDKFSKYTYRQIYDELGEEDFFNYIDDIVKKTIKNIKGLNRATLVKDGIARFYVQASIELVIGIFQSTILIKIENRRKIVWDIESDPNQTNIGEYIKKTIIEGCKKGKVPIT